METLTRADVLNRLKRSKQIKQNAVERIKGELADIVEEETGTSPTKFYVLWLNFLLSSQGKADIDIPA